ncbi:MAG: hypothetical protein ACLUKN_01115 [Bacilli bacterium]
MKDEKEKQELKASLFQGQVAFVITCLALVFAPCSPGSTICMLSAATPAYKQPTKSETNLTISARRSDIVDARKNLLATSRGDNYRRGSSGFYIKSGFETLKGCKKPRKFLKLIFKN